MNSSAAYLRAWKKKFLKIWGKRVWKRATWMTWESEHEMWRSLYHMLTPSRDHLHGRGTTQPRRRNDSASDVIQPPSSATPVLAQWAPESGRHVDSDGDLHTGLVWALNHHSWSSYAAVKCSPASNRAPHTASGLEETNKPLGSNRINWKITVSFRNPSQNQAVMLDLYFEVLLVRY